MIPRPLLAALAAMAIAIPSVCSAQNPALSFSGTAQTQALPHVKNDSLSYNIDEALPNNFPLQSARSESQALSFSMQNRLDASRQSLMKTDQLSAQTLRAGSTRAKLQFAALKMNDLEMYQVVPASYSYSALQREATKLVNRAPTTLRNASDLACIAVAIYHEARSESAYGQLAVGSVIQQRALVTGRWGNTPCSVVQPIQFSFMRSKYNFDPILERDAWIVAVNLAVKSLIDGPIPELQGADHYHTTQVHPPWRTHMVRIGRIGSHIFYRDPDSSTT